MAASLQVRSYSVVEKNLTSSQPLAAAAIAYLVPSFTKHWGVVLDVYDGNGIPRYRKLLEAYDQQGVLHSEMTDYDEPWNESPGFKETQVILRDNYPAYSNPALNAFIENINIARKSYHLISENCQEFIRYLLVFLGIQDSWACYLRTAKQTCSEAISWSLQLSSRSCYYVFKQLFEKISREGVVRVFRESLELLGRGAAEAFRRIGTETGEVFVQVIKEEATRLIVNAEQEIVEALLNASRGAFTWWQLLQIPVELGVRLLMESEWFQDELDYRDPTGKWAYAVSKIASIGYAGLVGLCMAGQWGLVGAVVIWFAQELITFGLRMISGWISTFYTSDGRDFFDRYIGPSKSLQLFNWIFNTDYQIPRRVRPAND
ncbi:uncharacterized protein LOC134851606 isoform X1 [Symsagittifera roscoffensis]|uniref:uncharacterized protein LOC134851606 isoform X1 n=1 Tax=Symsagittifera roscoffensis TaxID=84072 RepID=UPI00307C68BF